MFSAGIRHNFDFKGGKFVTNIFGNYVGKQFHDSANTEELSADGSNGAIPSYTVLNASIGYSAKKWGVNLALHNLFNEEYFTKRQAYFGGILPSATRNFRLNFSYKF